MNEEADEALFGALAIDRDDRFDSVELFADAMLPHMGDARRGARELAVLVGEACDDGADCDEGCGSASAFLPGRGGSHAGLSMIDRMAPRTKALVARLWAAVVCGFAAFEAAANIPACMTIAGRMEPAFWGVVGVAVAAALAWPGAGAAFAVGALVVALALSGSPFLALALALAGVAWLALGGARHHACANVGTTAVLAGAFGFAPVVPLLAGYFLNVKHAVAATVFAVVSAFCLACAGSLDLTGWNVFAFGAMPGASAMEDAALSLVASPNVWVMAASWLVAAVVGSLLCARGNRGLAACGMLAATTILVLGVIAATRLGGADFPDVAQLAPALVAGIAMTCATAAGVPSRE